MKKAIMFLFIVLPFTATAQQSESNFSDSIPVWIALVISLVILYFIIESATKSRKRQEELIRQNFYLRAIAEKLGVTNEVLDTIDDNINTSPVVNPPGKSS